MNGVAFSSIEESATIACTIAENGRKLQSMQPDDFALDAPGQLVRIPEGWAFIPALMPPELKLSRPLLVAVEQARGAVSEFVGQARLVQNLDLIIGPLTRREAVLSSRIEGTRTEVRDVLLAQASSDVLDEDSDLFEVINYLRALEQGRKWAADGRPLNLHLIRGLHAELMRGVRGQNKHPGAVRESQVYIGDRALGLGVARFVPPPPEQVLPLMGDLAEFINGPAIYGRLIDCALVHYQFEAIHPFEDGNGRLGRLLIPLVLLATGVLDRPVLYLSSYFEEHRATYIELLRYVSTKGAWDEWVLFFLDALKSQAEDSLARVQRILELHSRYRELVRAVSSKAARPAIELIMDSVYVTTSRLAGFAATSFHTARAAIDGLVELGILVPYGRIRGSQVWEARELLLTVYQD